ADEVLSMALAYSNVVFAGAVLIWMVNTLSSVLRGSGDMLFTAAVILAGEVLHLALAPILIFGLGPVPALGVTGAGLSLVISYVVRTAILAGYILMGRSATTI